MLTISGLPARRDVSRFHWHSDASYATAAVEADRWLTAALACEQSVARMHLLLQQYREEKFTLNRSQNCIEM